MEKQKAITYTSFKLPPLPESIQFEFQAVEILGGKKNKICPIIEALLAETKTISVGLLTYDAIEMVTEQWSQSFREHCRSKREAKS